MLAVLPLGAAFRIYGMIPAFAEVMPGVYESTGRNFVWVLPILHVFLATGLYLLTRDMSKRIVARIEGTGRKTDLAQVLPWLRLFVLLWLTAICLAVIYGYYVQESAMPLIGRISAVIPGLGVSVWALHISHATHENVLALRFIYTERSLQVWLRVHQVGARVLYGAGAVMMGAGILLQGLQAVFLAFFALICALLMLYLYARHLYESEFYR